MLNNKVILLTGGTGSFGKWFTRIILDRFNPRALRIFSRDELKQFEMQKEFGGDERLRFFIGDIRDKERVRRAFDEVDIVVHAAALKQVPALEYNPFEAVHTNILGAENIINAAIDMGVKQVIGLSTDKAVNPINLYGATKLCMEKLFINGNSYAGTHRTKFSIVRYGNVIGSRGSVVPLYKEKAKDGVIPVTNERMTRFWITLDQGVDFVLKCLDKMHGGEIFVPKIPSLRIVDLARIMAPDCKINVVGIRPGEKIYEVLISKDESRRALEFDDFFVVQPDFKWWNYQNWKGGKPLKDQQEYNSETNECYLSDDEMKKLLKSV